MDQIAIVGQNEMQRTIQGSYEKLLDEGVSPNGVSKTESTSEVTNDKGLTIESSPAGVDMRGLSPVAKHEIGAPSVQQENVSGLLQNVVKTFNSDEENVVDEREIVRLQDENDNAMQETAFKRNEGARQGVNEKFGDQIISLCVKGGEIPEGSESGEIASKSAGVAGAAVGFALSLAFTIVTGGAGIAALVASSVGLASSITEAAGGYEEIQEGISLLIQENNPGKTKEECDSIASGITTGVQVGIEIAQTVVSLKAPGPQKPLSGTLNTIKKSGAPMKVVNEKVLMAGNEAAKQFYKVEKPTMDQINTMISQAEKIGKIDNAFKYVDMGVKGLGLGTDIWHQHDSMKNEDKNKEIQAELELTQADQEQVLGVLSECGADFERINKRIKKNAGKLESILSSQTQGLSDILNETSDIGG